MVSIFHKSINSISERELSVEHKSYSHKPQKKNTQEKQSMKAKKKKEIPLSLIVGAAVVGFILLLIRFSSMG
ncbi:MAG TPA: hypothetical protein DCL21_05200 [Alphaproteobacteria bacterium]|nr:hypothetical protein [Alphaproteobacteria bacterium]